MIKKKYALWALTAGLALLCFCIIFFLKEPDSSGTGEQKAEQVEVFSEKSQSSEPHNSYAPSKITAQEEKEEVTPPISQNRDSSEEEQLTFDFLEERLSLKVLRILNGENRLQSVRSLPFNLNPDEVAALLGFLMKEPEGSTSLYYEMIRNDLLAQLLLQHRLDPRVGEAMQWMVAHSETNVTWRDYVAQAFPHYFSRQFSAGRPQDSQPAQQEEYDSLMETWWATTDQRTETAAGTALVGLLHQFSTNEEELEKIGTQALEVARDRNANEHSRATAMQVAANVGHEDILMISRQHLNGNASMSLKRSAIAAIGTLGGKSDIEIIKQLMDDPESVVGLEKAIETSLRKIEERVSVGD